MIEQNKNPAGRVSNMAFGIAQLLDGLIRVFSLGHLHTRFPIEYAKHQAKKRIQQLKGNKK